MDRLRKTRITAATAALALTIGGAVAVVPALADGSVETAAGQLVLTTGATDAVTYGDNTQALTTSGACTLSTSGSDLLTITGSIGAKSLPAGFKSDSIGVDERLASLCNQVDTYSNVGSETITLSLGSDVQYLPGVPALATSASLDLEVRSLWFQKARVKAVATLDGATVGSVELAQGAGDCKVSDGGNCRLTITPGGRFDTLQLTALKGAFALEGGSDSGASPSTVDLVADVDAVLDCVTDPTISDGSTSIEYLGNADGSTCNGFGATLTGGDEEVQFLKPLAVDPTAQFLVDIDWKQDGTGTPAATLPDATIDFEIGTENVTTMEFCPDYLYNTEGELVGITNPADIASLPDYEPDLAGSQFACIGTRSAEVDASTVTISDKIFLFGDAKMRLG